MKTKTERKPRALNRGKGKRVGSGALLALFFMIEIPDSYVTEKLSNGFSFYAGNRMAHAAFTKACVELGHRLAMEGKDIVEVAVIENRSFERAQDEISVRVKIRHRLRGANSQDQPTPGTVRRNLFDV